jgi:hypothetical protein
MALGAMLYHLLSGKAHAETWANVLGGEVVSTDGADPLLKTEFSHSTGLPAMEHVVRLHRRATGAYCLVMGADVNEWSRASGAFMPLWLDLAQS